MTAPEQEPQKQGASALDRVLTALFLAADVLRQPPADDILAAQQELAQLREQARLREIDCATTEAENAQLRADLADVARAETVAAAAIDIVQDCRAALGIDKGESLTAHVIGQRDRLALCLKQYGALRAHVHVVTGAASDELAEDAVARVAQERDAAQALLADVARLEAWQSVPVRDGVLIERTVVPIINGFAARERAVGEDDAVTVAVAPSLAALGAAVATEGK